MTLSIRTFQDSDAEAVGRLMADCYRALASQEGYTESERRGLLDQCSPPAIRERYARYESLVAGQAGRAVGVIALERDMIAELFVAPDVQGQGIGKALVRAAEAAIARAGHEQVTVWSATAPGYYERLGYAVSQRTTCDDGPLKGRPITVLSRPVGIAT